MSLKRAVENNWSIVLAVVISVGCLVLYIQRLTRRDRVIIQYKTPAGQKGTNR